MTQEYPPRHEQVVDVDIKKAQSSDAEAICDVRDRAWIEAYPNAELGISAEDIKINAQGRNGEFLRKRIEYLRQELSTQDGKPAVYVAKKGEKIVGFVDSVIDNQGRQLISALYVTPEYQGKGIGGSLLETALGTFDTGKDVFLEVVSYNQNAINFYKRFGFEKTDTPVPKEEGAPDYVKPLPQIEMVLKAA